MGISGSSVTFYVSKNVVAAWPIVIVVIIIIIIIIARSIIGTITTLWSTDCSESISNWIQVEQIFKWLLSWIVRFNDDPMRRSAFCTPKSKNHLSDHAGLLYITQFYSMVKISKLIMRPIYVFFFLDFCNIWESFAWMIIKSFHLNMSVNVISSTGLIRLTKDSASTNDNNESFSQHVAFCSLSLSLSPSYFDFICFSCAAFFVFFFEKQV